MRPRVLAESHQKVRRLYVPSYQNGYIAVVQLGSIANLLVCLTLENPLPLFYFLLFVLSMNI